MKMPAYPQISMQETGRHLHYLCHIAGYTARDLQMYCHLSNPQSVYKWFSGSTLPTVDNLYAISVLLGISMNDIIVCTDDDVVFLSRFSIDIPQPRSHRHVKYRIFPNQINKKAKGQKASLKKTGRIPVFRGSSAGLFCNRKKK